MAVCFKYTPFNPNNIINNISPEDNFENLSEYTNLIISQDNNNNLIFIRNLIFKLSYLNMEKIHEIILNIYNKILDNFYNKIQDNIKNNKFSLDLFFEFYAEYKSNSQQIKLHFEYFEPLIIEEDYLDNLESELYFTGILNSHLNLDQIFIKILNSEKINTDNLIDLVQLYSDYNNQYDTKLLFPSLGSDNNLIKKLVNFIHKSIKYLSNNQNNNLKFDIADLIQNMIYHVDDRQLFDLYYEAMLENRLNSNPNINLEKEFISLFNKPADNRLIQNILYKIEDIEISEKNRLAYNKIIVTPSSKKYGGLDISKIKREIIDIKIFRFYAWSDSHNLDDSNFSPPLDLSIYTDIYSKYYESLYPDRELVWNFNLGQGAVALKIQNKTYKLLLTTPQIFLLFQFNSGKTKLSATELAKNLNMPLAKLGPILNSFLSMEILRRDPGPKTDPNILIFINQEFKYDQDEISLIKKTNINNIEPEIKTKYAIGREIILQAKITKILKSKKNISREELLKLLDITNINLFETAIELCIAQKILEKNNNGYKYTEFEDSDSDQD